MPRGFGSALSFGVAVGLIGVGASLVPFVMHLEENAGLDWMFGLRGRRAPPPEVVIVAMDRNSASALGISDEPGRWPRSLHARLIGALKTAGAGAIVFDLFFDQPGPPEVDREFADAIRAAGNVVLGARLRKDVLATPSAPSARAPDAFSLRLIPPVEPIASSALAIAPFPLPVVPMKVSQVWLMQPGSGDRPTLPFAGVEALARSTHDQRPRDRLARWREQGSSLFLNFYGPARTVTTLPYDRMLSGTPPPDLRGKIVFVGYSARTQAEQRDAFRTVYTEENGLNVSGVEIAATAAGNLLESRPLRPLPLPPGLALMAVWGLALGVACRLLFGAVGSTVAVLAAAGYVAIAAFAFRTLDLWMPVIVPVFLQAPLAAFGALFLQFRQVRAQGERIRAALGHYVPPMQADRLAREGVEAGGAEIVYGTCMATDAAQYSLMSETLAPDELGRLMNSYYKLLFAEVERQGGFVSDVVGDAMMAIWASARPEQELRGQALKAAHNMLAEIARCAAAGERHALPTRIGLHSGEIRLGNIGAGQHLEYRAVGDIVNTASRIEGLNKQLGTRILASVETLQDLDGFRTRELGAFIFAGKSAPVTVHEMLGLAGVSAEPTEATLAEALALFRAERWQEAARLFRSCYGSAACDGPAHFYAGLCDEVLRSGRSCLENGAVRLSGK
jgi:adenylate cyclase